MGNAWPCAGCNEPVRNRLDQFRERVEYVRADGRERLACITIRLLCRECAVQAGLLRRGEPYGDEWEQPSMFTEVPP